jgi:hypothetical protein
MRLKNHRSKGWTVPLNTLELPDFRLRCFIQGEFPDNLWINELTTFLQIVFANFNNFIKKIRKPAQFTDHRRQNSHLFSASEFLNSFLEVLLPNNLFLYLWKGNSQFFNAITISGT